MNVWRVKRGRTVAAQERGEVKKRERKGKGDRPEAEETISNRLLLGGTRRRNQNQGNMNLPGDGTAALFNSPGS